MKSEYSHGPHRRFCRVLCHGAHAPYGRAALVRALALALAASCLGLAATQALAMSERQRALIEDACEGDGNKACEPEPARAPAPWRPWQRVWQCNDIRVTETMQREGFIHYDLAGTIVGGGQFALDLRGRGQLFFNSRP